GLFYAVQIASASNKIKDPRELGYSGTVNELKTDNRYRYYTGKADSYAKVMQNLERIRKKIKDCFVIAVYNGKLIKIEEAKNLEKKLK
ncbi:MAG: N-acetylmuramoyl-L-alanine amidase, partial [Odoribacter sp.]|nr:N-acetylmuramoyl-L-alanine amidase [Odoribacter sp.]